MASVRVSCAMCGQKQDLKTDDLVINVVEQGRTVIFTCVHCGAFCEKIIDEQVEKLLLQVGVLTVDELVSWLTDELEES